MPRARFVRSKLPILALFLLASLASHAQVLARPGWAGSGVAPESWWRRAVFYRLNPSQFQDSDGDGQGDLAGVIQRLDYLQSTGADALLLDNNSLNDPTHPAPLADLEDLIRAASNRHLRVLLTVPATTPGTPQSTLLTTVHDWLSAGAAGVYLPSSAQPGNGAATLLPALQAMLRSFPGDRVLLSDVAPATTPSAAATSRRNPHGDLAPHGASLVTAARFALVSSNPAPLRSSLAGAATSPDPNPLVQVALDPPSGSPLDAVAGALLFASRGAAILNAGDEIGLNLNPAQSAQPSTSFPVMQWTPSNRTAAPTADAEAKPAAPETVYGAYHPYQPLVRGLASTLPAPVRVAPDPNIAPDPPAPDTLPGFTAGTLLSPPLDGARLNVVTEDRNPTSLLNFYRQLIGLHHDNPTLRNGTQIVLNYDAQGALVWLRRAPDNSRTAADVVVAANLSDQPVTLDLDTDLASSGMRPGALRPLASYTSQPITGASTAHLTLPAHAVLLGELIHGGRSDGPAPYRRRSRHRVRR